MQGEPWVPDFDTLVVELRAVRESGMPGLRRLQPETLGRVAKLADLTAHPDSEAFEPAAVEDLLRRAADTFGGGTDQDIAEYTFGLAQGYRVRTAQDRRSKAADLYGVKADSFRKEPERLVIEQMAEGVLRVLRSTQVPRFNRNNRDMESAVFDVNVDELLQGQMAPQGIKFLFEQVSEILRRRREEHDAQETPQDLPDTHLEECVRAVAAARVARQPEAIELATNRLREILNQYLNDSTICPQGWPSTDREEIRAKLEIRNLDGKATGVHVGPSRAPHVVSAELHVDSATETSEIVGIRID